MAKGGTDREDIGREERYSGSGSVIIELVTALQKLFLYVRSNDARSRNAIQDHFTSVSTHCTEGKSAKVRRVIISCIFTDNSLQHARSKYSASGLFLASSITVG